MLIMDPNAGVHFLVETDQDSLKYQDQMSAIALLLWALPIGWHSQNLQFLLDQNRLQREYQNMNERGRITVVKSNRKKEIPWTTTVDNLCPRSDKQLQIYANEIREWANTTKRVKVDQYCDEIRVDRAVFRKWRERYAPLEEAYQQARQIIGDRREEYGLFNKFNSSIVEKTMGMYNEEYKEFLKWKAEINKHTQVNNETKIVVVDRYPSTDAVPEKK